MCRRGSLDVRYVICDMLYVRVVVWDLERLVNDDGWR